MENKFNKKKTYVFGYITYNCAVKDKVFFLLFFNTATKKIWNFKVTI